MTDLIVDAEFQDPAQKNCPSRGLKIYNVLKVRSDFK